MAFNFAASRVVNSPGESIQLTQAQVWKGLCMKSKEPQKFLPNIISCDILSESGNKITRAIRVRNGPSIKEEVELYEPSIVYFDSAEADIRIVNMMSYNEQNELLLAYSFVGGIPGYHPASSEPTIEELNQTVGTAIQSTIDRIRELVKEGRL